MSHQYLRGIPTWHDSGYVGSSGVLGIPPRGWLRIVAWRIVKYDEPWRSVLRILHATVHPRLCGEYGWWGRANGVLIESEGLLPSAAGAIVSLVELQANATIDPPT